MSMLQSSRREGGIAIIKKTVALATLASFLVFSCSCIYSWKKTPLVSVKPEKRTKVKISAVQVHSGEKTEFSKDPAAKIQGDSVVGTRVIKNFKLEKSKIREQVSTKTGVAYRIVTTDGVVYITEWINAQDDSSVTFDAYFQASIPLADVDLVWIKKFDILWTVVFCASVAVGALFGLAYFMAAHTA